jgi:hypothetical protein
MIDDFGRTLAHEFPSVSFIVSCHLIRWYSHGTKFDDFGGGVFKFLFFDSGNVCVANRENLQRRDASPKHFELLFHHSEFSSVFAKSLFEFTTAYRAEREYHWETFSQSGSFPWRARTQLATQHAACEDEEEIARPQSTRRQRSGFVYLMHNRRNGYFKIGFTSRTPEFRESTLQAEDPDIEVLASVEGTTDDEVALHHRFRDFRLRGEWFELPKSVVKDLRAEMKKQIDKPAISSPIPPQVD